MLPYVQAMLLDCHLRGDLDEYLPFFWKYLLEVEILCW